MNLTIRLLAFIVLISFPAYAQIQGDELYIFPRLLVKVDTQRWKTDNYATFLNSLKGFADLKSKSDPDIRISIRPFTDITDATVYSKCKCNPEYHETYPRYQKVLQARRMVVEKDTFHLSVHQSHDKKVSFHIATCKADPQICQWRISAVGPVKDSAFVKESLIGAATHIRQTTPAGADAMFNLPQPEEERTKAMRQQLAYYDAVWRDQYKRDLATASDKYRDNLIKSIRQSHANNYEPVGWTSLPELEQLPLDTLVRIKARYYHPSYTGGAEKMKLAPQFFPPAFTYTLYAQSLMKLISGEFTMDDVARLYFRESFGPGQPFYYSKITASTDSYALMFFTRMVKPLFPGYDIKDANAPYAPVDNTLIFTVAHQVSPRSRAQGYVLYKRDGDRFTKEIVPPLWTEENNTRLGDMTTPHPYRLRELTDWDNSYTYQVKRIYLLDHKKGIPSWISYSLPVLNDTSYTITFQFSGSFEERPVINMPKWSRIQPGDQPDNYYKVKQVRDNEDISKELKRDEADRNKLLRSAAPHDRLYTYTWLVEDINKDGKKDLVSFSVSNGKMVFYQCYTDSPNGLVPMTGKKVATQIMNTESYKKLHQRSLLAADMKE